MERIVTYFTLFSMFFAFVNSNSVKLHEAKSAHRALDLSDQDIKSLASLANEAHLQEVLKEILIPRVVGTKNHAKVANFISNQMRDLGWDVSEDVFTDKTPLGNLKFKNIIAKMNPIADRFLVLACHYDSKYSRENNFVGATDSAVPCAMMINLAKVMAPLLNGCNTQNDLSLMFIFFDGEEAFRQWSSTDSIYGARHLARKWETTPYKDGANHLQRIDVLVLLDLLGTPDPVFYSYFQNTEQWYIRLANAEQRLANLNKLRGYSRGSSEQTYFRLRSSGSLIEDDHIPFLKRNVPIVHMITSPFPDVWHTPADNYSALDFNTIENLNKILRVFVAEYLRVKP